MKRLFCAVLGVACLASGKSAFADGDAMELEAMEVIGVTPLPGSDVPVDKIPANIQTVTSEQLQNAQAISLAEYLNRYLGSVHVNDAQNNPLQPDIYYRGFVASPLLGLPQGLSTYVNGVRFNEPFGDTVNWDLVPEGAIESMALYPGSNPVYGLNSLGGAISVRTKTGFSAPGHQVEAYGGSWGRHSEELTSGWNNGTWGYFLDLHHFEEEGWRDFSPTKADQAFGTLSWRGDKGSLDLTLGGNDNDLRGNGAVPVQLLDEHRKAVFTHPDQTITRMFFSELEGSYAVTDDIELSGNAYFRQNRIKTFNGDDSDFEACRDAGNASFLCEEDDGDEERVADIFGNDILASDAVEGATNNTSQTNMRSRGGTLQATFGQDLFKHKNSLTTGVSYDYAKVNFSSDTELGSLTSTRGTTRSGVLVDESRVRLDTNTSTVGVFLTDTFDVTEKLSATIAGRYNYSHINMIDQYVNDPGKTLDGSHTFERLNPSGGLTYKLLDNLTVYGGYSESSRIPSPMELSCADPEAPCKLPNSFVADPPLEQVVAKTYEGGFRGDLNQLLGHGELKWNLGYFHTTNSNDIIFQRGGDSISEGFFDNVGKTRRYGVEAGAMVNYPQLFSSIDDWHFMTNYTYLNARFLSGFKTQDPVDEDNDEGVMVEKGDRIPGIPEHMFKAAVSVDLWQKVSLGMDGTYSGARFFRGDEANNHDKLSGYWLFNGKAEYKVTQNFAVFGRVDNIFDKRYNSFGVYGEADEVLGDAYDDGRFVSPGAPRAGWIGVRLSM
ncbi:TonB-dependent receptor [Methylicorpusculum sp.]|uniref:TonB-dependent receptor n=1 Tax=Methylicorpusculum sp. TaxID=2713644 RepID=UPI00271F482C|nr:TonB-dependent receptor [Methylicorpusculum sp.]MDO8844223.1 TonB-dependent receptor [Methylicorpusculum sp.]